MDRPDFLFFQISTNATSLTNRTWADVHSLHSTSPSTTAPLGFARRQRSRKPYGGHRNGRCERRAGRDVLDPVRRLQRTGIRRRPGRRRLLDDRRHRRSGAERHGHNSRRRRTGVTTGANIPDHLQRARERLRRWYAISCGTTGAHPATAAGGPHHLHAQPGDRLRGQRDLHRPGPRFGRHRPGRDGSPGQHVGEPRVHLHDRGDASAGGSDPRDPGCLAYGRDPRSGCRRRRHRDREARQRLLHAGPEPGRRRRDVRGDLRLHVDNADRERRRLGPRQWDRGRVPARRSHQRESHRYRDHRPDDRPCCRPATRFLRQP